MKDKKPVELSTKDKVAEMLTLALVILILIGIFLKVVFV